MCKTIYYKRPDGDFDCIESPRELKAIASIIKYLGEPSDDDHCLCPVDVEATAILNDLQFSRDDTGDYTIQQARRVCK